jgi:hypothetical protein
MQVLMGAAYCTRTKHTFQRRPPDNKETPGDPFDSIFAQKGVANGGHQKHYEAYDTRERSSAVNLCLLISEKSA